MSIPCANALTPPLQTPTHTHRADKDGNVVICGIMQHIEQAGVHSGDSACSIPPQTISEECLATIREVRGWKWGGGGGGGSGQAEQAQHYALYAVRCSCRGWPPAACWQAPHCHCTHICLNLPAWLPTPHLPPRSGPPSWPRRSRWWASSTFSTRCRTTR